MLNEADSYQGGGSAGAEASEPVKDAEALFRKLKRFVKTDYNSKGQVNWRREAREDFDFDAGEQLNDEDKAILADAKRPIVISNRVGTTVDSVAGQEVGDRRHGAPLLTRIVCLKYPDLFKNQKFSRAAGRRLDANRSPPRQGWGPARGQSG